MIIYHGSLGKYPVRLLKHGVFNSWFFAFQDLIKFPKTFLSLYSFVIHIMKKVIWILIFAGLVIQGFSQTREVPFTLDDRDRIMRTEEQLQSLRKEMNAKFEAVDQRFEAVDSKIETIYWGLGIIITLILFMLGYMIWDRRTAFHPIQEKTRDHEERLRKLEYLSKEQAKKDPDFAEMLRMSGLL